MEHCGNLSGSLCLDDDCTLVLNKHITIETEKPTNRATWTDIFKFFNRKEILSQLGFLVLYYMGIIGILSMIRPYLVDKGYDMKEIGFLMGIVGTSVSFVMAWFSGVLIRRIGIHKARDYRCCNDNPCSNLLPCNNFHGV